MPRNLPALLFDARGALSVGSQGELGTLLGSSVRSGQRWALGEATPMPGQLENLAALVFPKDASLAAEIAEAAGSTLAQLGIVHPPAPPPPAAPPPDPIHIVDTVVCAAAEEMQLTPQAIRPAVRAAFRRARLTGLSVDTVDDALSGRTSQQADAAPSAKRTGARQKAK